VYEVDIPGIKIDDWLSYQPAVWRKAPAGYLFLRVLSGPAASNPGVEQKARPRAVDSGREVGEGRASAHAQER
jgi:hypothetical protein